MSGPFAEGGPTTQSLRRSVLSAAAVMVHDACCQEHALDALVAVGAADPRPDGWRDPRRVASHCHGARPTVRPPT